MDIGTGSVLVRTIMGYYIIYSLKLRIKASNIQRALDIFNNLHTDEMLVRYARGGLFPQTGSIRKCYWYSWVINPITEYKTLQEAFDNWCIVEDQVQYTTNVDGEFIVSGDYDNKWGQQDFLIQQLAPVLENTEVLVFGEDHRRYHWMVVDHTFSSYQEDEDEDEEVDDTEEEWEDECDDDWIDVESEDKSGEPPTGGEDKSGEPHPHQD